MGGGQIVAGMDCRKGQGVGARRVGQGKWGDGGGEGGGERGWGEGGQIVAGRDCRKGQGGGGKKGGAREVG